MSFSEEMIKTTLAAGKSSTSFLTLYSGFRYFKLEFDSGSHRETGVIAYVETMTAWIGAADPMVSVENLPALFAAFQLAAKKKNRAAAILPVSFSTVEVARKLGYFTLQIGSEPWFTLDDPVRSLPIARQLKTKGALVEQFNPTVLSTNERLELDMITQEWLESRKMAALSFLNRLEPWMLVHYKKYFRVIFHGHQIGYLAAVPIPVRKAWYLVDLIRSNHAPLGTTELLVAEAMRQLKDEGALEVTLGMAPFVPVVPEEAKLHSMTYRCFDLFFKHLNFFYGFQSLFNYKEKFTPNRWEPQYMIALSGSLGWKTYFGLFQAIFPRGLFHTLFSTFMRIPRQLSPAKIYRYFLNDDLVPRTPPRGLGNYLIRCKATSLIIVGSFLYFFTSVDDHYHLRNAMVERYAYSWNHFFVKGFSFESGIDIVIASFLHWNFFHLLANTLFLIIFVSFLECAVGTVFAFSIYLAGMFLANPLTTFLLEPFIKIFVPHLVPFFNQEVDVGCSLGIFSCIGALAAFSKFPKFMMTSF